MYWSAISTRLLVGIFTPAIRATDFSPVADPSWAGSFLSHFGQVSANANTTPFPLDAWGPASSENYPTWIRGLLKDSTWFRQPSLCLSSLFRDLFSGFPGLLAAPLATSRPGTRGSLPKRLFGPFGGRFPGLPGSLGALPAGSRPLTRGFGHASAGHFGALGDSPGRGRFFGCFGFHRADRGKDAVNLPCHVFDGHHAIDGQQLAPFRIVVNQRLGL